MKPALLFLCHRIPYPPNKGDKIRSWHALEFLSRYYRVFLGTFIDDPDDWKYVQTLQHTCEACFFVPLSPGNAKFRSLGGLATGQPLSLNYYFSRPMQSWVNEIIGAHQIARAFIFSSPMAQYLSTGNNALSRRVIDFVDIDSDKWRQYAERKTWPISWLYRREAHRLLNFEKLVSRIFDASLFVSRAEADLYIKFVPESQEKVHFYNNGVDRDYFSPYIDLKTPYSVDEQVLVFTGAMDYWPNVDAVVWFANHIFPKILDKVPQARFYVVGGKPVDIVMKLQNLPGIRVTGRVSDVRPYLKYAVAAVAPMRVARGIQNKVLEAMAMCKPVMVSPQGLEGIEAEPGKEVLLANNEEDFVRYSREIADGNYSDMGAAARKKVIDEFNWEKNLQQLLEVFEEGELSTKDSLLNESI